jgi:hypothetical protein
MITTETIQRFAQAKLPLSTGLINDLPLKIHQIEKVSNRTKNDKHL